MKYWSWYGFEAGVEWCACFVSWCANECGYIDSVGGHHDAGVGWMPDGHYCGECSHSTCEVCSIWKGKQARQELGGIPAHRLKQIFAQQIAVGGSAYEI